jgi:calcium-dependent protein kinase
LLILVSLIDEHEFDENRRTFQTIDIDHSGSIDKQELKKALTLLVEEEEMSEQDFEELANKVDFDRNGTISYSEFLACTLSRSQLDQANLQNLFVYLDIFGVGYLTKESLLMSFRRRGKTTKPEEISQMMTEMGLDPESKLTYETFTNLMNDILTN